MIQIYADREGKRFKVTHVGVTCFVVSEQGITVDEFIPVNTTERAWMEGQGFRALGLPFDDRTGYAVCWPDGMDQ